MLKHFQIAEYDKSPALQTSQKILGSTFFLLILTVIPKVLLSYN